MPAFKEGATGDDDLLSNGKINDVPGPTSVHVLGTLAAYMPATPGAPEPAVSGGGRGCTIGEPAQRDVSLTLLALLAAIGMSWRALLRRAARERRS